MFTVNEVAKKLSVNPTTVRRYIQQKKIDHIKIGKSVRFTQEHIDNFIAKHTVSAQPNGGEK